MVTVVFLFFLGMVFALKRSGIKFRVLDAVCASAVVMSFTAKAYLYDPSQSYAGLGILLNLIVWSLIFTALYAYGSEGRERRFVAAVWVLLLCLMPIAHVLRAAIDSSVIVNTDVLLWYFSYILGSALCAAVISYKGRCRLSLWAAVVVAYVLLYFVGGFLTQSGRTIGTFLLSLSPALVGILMSGVSRLVFGQGFVSLLHSPDSKVEAESSTDA
jgi:hypothetical protein